MTVRTKIGGLYVDDLRYSDPSSTIALINTIPADTETDVATFQVIDLHVVCLVAAALIPNVKVWITRTGTGVRDLAYDQGAGGFQAGYTGTGVVRTSIGSALDDELILSIQPDVAFDSLDTILIEVMAFAGGYPDPSELSYSFTIEDITAPELDEILWLTPRKCRVKFDEPVSTLTTPGGSLFSFYTAGNVEVISASQIRIPGATLLSSWAGLWCSLHGSAYTTNNRYRPVASVNSSTYTITLDVSGDYGSLIPDDGQDRDSSGILVRSRDIGCGVSPWNISARLSSEGSTELPQSSERIQCSFLPTVISVEGLTASEIAPGETLSRYVYLIWHDDISLGRLYTLRADGIQDVWQNAMAASTINFTSPTFGSPPLRMKLWQDGLIPATDRLGDEAGSGDLRRLVVVLQDLLNVLWYRVDRLQYLMDPDFCPDAWLDHFLYNLGNPFRFPLETTYIKRKLIAGLIGFYKGVGTVEGIEEMLYVLLGIWFTIRPYVTADGWILGDAVYGILGYTTICGPSTEFARNSYEVVSPVDLTDEELRIVVDVCTWADPINMHLVRVIMPSTMSGSTTASTNYWILGTHILGSSTILGGP